MSRKCSKVLRKSFTRLDTQAPRRSDRRVLTASLPTGRPRPPKLSATRWVTDSEDRQEEGTVPEEEEDEEGGEEEEEGSVTRSPSKHSSLERSQEVNNGTAESDGQ